MSDGGGSPRRSHQLAAFDAAIAGEIRARMARKQISEPSLARRIGWSQQVFNSRKLGYVAFTASELVIVCDAIEEDIASVLGAAKREARKTNLCLSDDEWVVADDVVAHFPGSYRLRVVA